ncbi:aldo/keto reductase family protein [Thiocapsa rosea]|uniref:Aflatoxin B1 aldehyde reductase n=1 Tax=Thiocapsa rosea TaxID=69360 RepID=A0A495V812_9GAMM|nr:aldo/keto reductase [Thiocapsa rosea]RKT45551.1 aflatoxin B1 aldehyde reductase [Thiocapsa rosea]
MATPVRLILGTMTFGPQVDPEGSKAMVRHFLGQGHLEIDTAYVYNGGDSERYLGDALKDVESSPVKLATKVNPRITGRLDADAIRMQLTESLTRLGQDRVDLLYLHFPDPGTPIESTLEACAELHSQGRFTALGLSNFPAWQVVHIWHLCKAQGWPLPEVYQGLYNGLSRSIEAELLPALRALGIRFYAYNPLAGGILAGKYASYHDEPTPGRFTFRPNYKARYWKKPFFDALDILAETCKASQVSLVEAAYRWLAWHSGLDGAERDGVIIGASNLAQLEQNIQIFAQGPLPDAVVAAFDTAWEAARPDAPEYFRTSV